MDIDLLVDIINTVISAEQAGKCFFQGNWKRQFLPQYNLPSTIERDGEIINPLLASLYLFTRTSIDRLSLSSDLLRYSLRAWDSKRENWIFFPEQVVERSITQVEQSLKHNFRYAVPIVSAVRVKNKEQEMSAGKGYYLNAKTLVEEYAGDPRKIIQGCTVEEANNRLENLYGFGPGISRLYMTELCDRNIAKPTNAQDLENKIDRHKARLLINTAVFQTEKEQLHMSGITALAQQAYTTAFSRIDHAPAHVDAAMWIIGSKGCAQQDYFNCKESCPLVNTYCKRSVRLNHITGQFQLKDGTGKDIDARKHLNVEQLNLFPTG